MMSNAIKRSNEKRTERWPLKPKLYILSNKINDIVLDYKSKCRINILKSILISINDWIMIE